MLIGSHDNNLYTNQELVGQILHDIGNRTEIIKLQFYNYLGEELLPLAITTKSQVPQQAAFSVNQEASGHQIGKIEPGSYVATWNIEGAYLKVINTWTGQDVVTEVNRFELLELQTSERSYTKFKFIQ